MKLPEEFIYKMKTLLGETEYEEFYKSYSDERYFGLRINTLKIDVEKFLTLSPFKLSRIPWTKDAFYYDGNENPGKHPYYYSGLYYIQEPSAMLPAAILDAKPGDKILDLCAAPGGKTVQIAAAMRGEGLLVANDINTDRVKALVKNVELCGVRNIIVTNDTPEKLSRNFQMYFDKILIDAPCSGEGMFRKDPDAVRKWENFKCDKCAGMQKDILESVDRMLKPGGLLVYSTCTFSPEENEQMISYFLDKHKNYSVLPIPKVAGIEDGRPDWSDGNPCLKNTARLWPHKVKGEGHFTALLKKGEDLFNPEDKNPNPSSKYVIPGAFSAFAKENLNINISGYFQIKGNNLYCLPIEPPSLSGIKTAKFGWYLGELINNKFEPSHSLCVSLNARDIKNTINFSGDSNEIQKYLKAETLTIEGEKGLVAVCVDGYTVGWAKQTGIMLKNLYPKGWRKMN